MYIEETHKWSLLQKSFLKPSYSITDTENVTRREMSLGTGHACLSKHHHLDTIKTILWGTCRERSLLSTLPTSACPAGHHVCPGLWESRYHLCVSTPLSFSLTLPSILLATVSLSVCIPLFLFLLLAHHLQSLLLVLFSFPSSLSHLVFPPPVLRLSLGVCLSRSFLSPHLFLSHPLLLPLLCFSLYLCLVSGVPLSLTLLLSVWPSLCQGPSLPCPGFSSVKLMETEVLPLSWPLPAVSPSVSRTHCDHFSSESPGQYKLPLFPIGSRWCLCAATQQRLPSRQRGRGGVNLVSVCPGGDALGSPAPWEICSGYIPKTRPPWDPTKHGDNILLSSASKLLFFCVLLIVRIIGALRRKLAAAAAAKWLQSCPTLCDPMDCSLPGFTIHGILQAKTLEWVAMLRQYEKQ